MARYNVQVNRTTTIEYSVDIEVSAKDEAAAVAKVEDRVNKALAAGKLDSFNWEESSTDDSFEYDASEA